jgi:hypothetical protein
LETEFGRSRALWQFLCTASTKTTKIPHISILVDLFHLSMTFLLSSDVPEPYGSFFVPPRLAAEQQLMPYLLPNDKETILRDKQIRGLLWFSSDCETPSR